MTKGRKIKNIFPKLKKDIADFCLKEEGNIEKKKLAKLGIALAILSIALDPGANAAMVHTSSGHDASDIHDSHTICEGTGGHYSAMTGHNANHSSTSEHSEHDANGPEG